MIAPGRWLLLIGLLALGLALSFLPACQSFLSPNVRRGQETFVGQSYDAIWNAAAKVADEHFEIKEQDRTRGFIAGRRSASSFRKLGERVEIHITPALEGSSRYTLEVVSRKRVGDWTEQAWARKVLRDIRAVLDGQPTR